VIDVLVPARPGAGACKQTLPSSLDFCKFMQYFGGFDSRGSSFIKVAEFAENPLVTERATLSVEKFILASRARICRPPEQAKGFFPIMEGVVVMKPR